MEVKRNSLNNTRGQLPLSPSQQQARVHYQVWCPSLGQLSAITVITRHSHFLIISYRAHHISAQPQQLVRWCGGRVVAKDARLLPGAAAGPAWCPALLSPLIVMFYNCARLCSVLSSQALSHVTTATTASSSQQQPVVSAAATSSTIFQLESRPNLYHCVNFVINQPRSERRLAVDDNVPL